MANDNELILAALWCVINLAWSDDDHSAKDRVEMLKKAGFLDIIRKHAGTSNMDLKDRVQTAIKYLSPEEQ